jgi:hypothetical protein
MKRVAILVAASATSAFYSQVAALRLAVHRLPWSRWQPSLHMYIGGQHDPATLDAWWPHLSDVDIHWTSAARFAQDGDWAQSDDVFISAPPEADVLLAMDADTLPVEPLEPILDQVVERGAVAGVIAHYPPFVPRDSSEPTSIHEAWTRLASDFLDTPLDFAYVHTLMGPEVQADQKAAPFYLNFGVVFLPREAFRAITSPYLTIRPQLMERMTSPDFSGQAALTLAIASAGVKTWALPMRYNFPNDPVAERMYPAELEAVVVFHYLRTAAFDRHDIFVNAQHYEEFLTLDLQGVNRRFQSAVRTIVGQRYPFA